MATPIAHKACGGLEGNGAVGGRLPHPPELVQAAKTYFNDVQLKTDKPEEFLPRATCRRSRSIGDHGSLPPEMRKFYYDASKYETYLDQLGVKFPTLAKGQ
jgi:aminobenzoyl-glutamate utilization protein B